MKKIKKTQANGFYIFRGEVAANSNFIETIAEAKQFLIYANYFLKGYLTVYEYMITRREWLMVVKLKSTIEICPTENAQQVDGQQVWQIISERMRLFLSRYALTINKMRGRTGTLVHSPYERFFFESLGEAKEVIETMRLQTHRFYKRKRKYRGLKKHYKIPKKIGRGSIFLCSKEVKKRENYGQNFLKNQYVSELTELVLSKLIDSTVKQHINQEKPFPYPQKN